MFRRQLESCKVCFELLVTQSIIHIEMNPMCLSFKDECMCIYAAPEGGGSADVSKKR